MTLICVLPLVLAGCGGAATSPVGTIAPAVTPAAPVTGPLGDTWTRDSGIWHEHKIAGPSPRYLSAIAYDAAHHVFVLFGGLTSGGSSNETWTFDGSNWHLQKPSHKPSPRRSVAMAFDSARNVIVLYGGLVATQGEGDIVADTWTWDGVDWTEVQATQGLPGEREGYQLVATPDGVLLFGGRFWNTHYYDDTWKFDGTTWRLFAKGGPNGPVARSAAAVAWDAHDAALLVFGGEQRNSAQGPGNQGIPLADTWLLTRQGWVSTNQNGPPATAFANAVWNDAHNRAEVMFGMACPTPVDDAWAWDRASGWSRLGALSVPARFAAATAQDPSGNVLLFGGDDERGC